MLINPRPEHFPIRRPRSLRQEYEEFVVEQIEEYKERLSRETLLQLADEAVRELEVGPEEQLVLTEVLVLDHVDRLIKKRLNLPSYRRWRNQHVRLRQRQQEPGHWGLDAANPLTELARHLEESDLALAVGARAASAAFFLASHDASVLFIAPDLDTVESAEHRAASEALSGRFQALVISLGGWFPDVTPALTLFDPTALADLDEETRSQFMVTLKSQTPRGGLHCLIPRSARSGVIPLTTEAVRRHYGDWISDGTPPATRSRWPVVRKP